MDRTKKVLITLLVIGALATVGVGTYATFTAQTNNTGNTVTTGTLILSNETGQNAATLCYSAGNAPGSAGAPAAIGGNAGVNNQNCSAVSFAALNKPGTSDTGKFTLKNVGSLAGSMLTVKIPSCTDTASATATYAAPTTGNPLCTTLSIQIQEYDATFTTPSASCIYPAAAAACGSTSGSLSGLSTATNVIGPLAANTAENVLITVSLPSSAGNSVQGLTSTFDLDWVLNQ